MTAELDYWMLDGHEPKRVTWDDYRAWMEQGFDVTKRVAATEIGDVRVSTVFLSIDHGWGDGPPVLFETMVFGGEMDENQWRYSTWDEAVAGHERVVTAVREGRIVE